MLSWFKFLLSTQWVLITLSPNYYGRAASNKTEAQANQGDNQASSKTNQRQQYSKFQGQGSILQVKTTTNIGPGNYSPQSSHDQTTAGIWCSHRQQIRGQHNSQKPKPNHRTQHILSIYRTNYQKMTLAFDNQGISNIKAHAQTLLH
jgi:hypothetical protein